MLLGGTGDRSEWHSETHKQGLLKGFTVERRGHGSGTFPLRPSVSSAVEFIHFRVSRGYLASDGFAVTLALCFEARDTDAVGCLVGPSRPRLSYLGTEGSRRLGFVDTLTIENTLGNLMANASAVEIARWFDDHSDGEFIRSPHDAPFSVNDPTPDAHCILYTTKPTTSQLLVERYFPNNKPGVVGRYGLPHAKDVTWLRDYVGDRQLYFLGDCDPVDILVFTWLRSYMEVAHFGVNDVLVSKLQVPLTDNLTIELSGRESHAVALLEKVCPEYPAVVGSECAALIACKRKLEVEALVSFARADGPTLADAFPL